MSDDELRSLAISGFQNAVDAVVEHELVSTADEEKLGQVVGEVRQMVSALGALSIRRFPYRHFF